MSEIYFIEIDSKIPFEKYETLMQVLPEKRREQIRKLHFDIDKKLSLVADLFIRSVACTVLGCSYIDLQFEKNEYGKPYFAGATDFHYNISHTKNAVAVGVSKEPVGIDVEKIRDYKMKLANRFFCEAEVNYIKKETENAPKHFYEIWTKKEAYVKWVGKGLSIPLNSFDVFDCTLPCRPEAVQVGGYIVSVCGNEYREGISVVRLEEKSLYEEFSGFFA